MTKHPLRKMFLTTILYLVIIVGIFAIQFRSETIISESFKSISLILSETKQENNTTKLKNEFKINFGGISLFTDLDNKATILETNEPLILQSFEKVLDKGFLLKFDNQIELSVFCTDDESSIPVTVMANLPAGVTGITIPYKVNGSYSPVQQDDSELQLLTKSEVFLFSAASLSDYQLVLTNQNIAATYSEYIESTEFKYADVMEFALAQKEKFDENKNLVKSRIQASLKEGITDNLSEKVVVSYVAEIAKNGKYSQSIADVPAALKSTSKRTYLSAPFFNNLVSMNKTLIMQLENIEYRTNHSLEQSDLSVFELNNFGLYLMTRSKTQAESILSRLLLDNSLVENATFRQAVGCLKTYKYIKRYSPETANILKNAVNLIVQNFEKQMLIEEDVLRFDETVQGYTTLDVAELGLMFAEYGSEIGNEELCKVGYLLFNQAISNVSATDFEVFASLYELIETENWYYPHLVILDNRGTTPIWAWTCAEKMSFMQNEDGQREIVSYFPQGDTHYIIVNGILPFDSIEIYNMPFRTDPRFETYNSSGYVYESDSNTLLLKSRHKSYAEPFLLD